MTPSGSRTSRGDPLTVVMAPDSLKGSLSATAAGRALAEGFLAARPASTILQAPMSDGGEGLVEILEHALGGEFRTARVADPLGRPVTVRYLVLPDGTAVLESAEAIGLTRLTADELDPFAASSRGLGQLIAAAAGGLGAMLLAMGATLTSGVELVMERVGLGEKLRGANLVITGEGSVDASSTEGKVVSGVCGAARTQHVPTVVFGGRVEPAIADLLRDSGVAAVLPLSGDPSRARVDCRALGQMLAELTDLAVDR